MEREVELDQATNVKADARRAFTHSMDEKLWGEASEDLPWEIGLSLEISVKILNRHF